MQYLLRMLFLVAVLVTNSVYASSTSSSSSSVAECQEKTRTTTQNFFSFGRINLQPVLIGENSAIGILGEIGEKNYRINGTYGLFLGDNHRFKAGGEYLSQKIQFRYLSGKERKWVDQWAAGGKYQYLIDCLPMPIFKDFVRGVQVSGYYSEARNHRPASVLCPNANIAIFRHIVGAQQWNAEGGLIIQPWCTATIIGTGGYDEFRFHRHFSKRHKFSGVSGTLYFNQRMWFNLSADVKAEFRKAYNYVEGMLSWGNHFCFGDLSVGVFGSHTWGKSNIPSVSTAGGELRFAFGVDRSSRCKCECREANDVCPSYLAQWVASPAVYIPQVFAATESAVCVGPSSTPFPLITGLGAAFDFGLGFSAVNLATNFTNPTGTPLVFTATNLPPEVSLQSNGALFVNNDGENPGIFDISVTATSQCGSTTLVIPILLEGGA